MRERLERALGLSRATFTEIRLCRVWSTTVAARSHRIELATFGEDLGGVVRCLVPGFGWGCAGFVGADRIDEAVCRADALSRMIPVTTPITLASIPVRVWESALPVPPEAPRLGEKRDLAAHLAAEMLGVDRRVNDARIVYQDSVRDSWLVTSEGSRIHDVSPTASVSAVAVAEEDGNVERAVVSFGARGGLEAVTGNAEAVRGAARTAVELLHAAPVRGGRFTVVLDPRAAGGLVHRSLGHLALAGRGESSLMGIGTRIGPDILSVGDDGTVVGLRSSLTYDDEGTPAQNTIIVRNGVLVHRLHTRETAAREGAAATGNARASGTGSGPTARLTNTYLSSGRGTRHDLVGEVSLGVYISDFVASAWGGDRVRLRAASARMIRHGELAEPVKNVELVGDLLALFGHVERIGADFSWDTAASFCDDGDAGRLAVTCGAPHVRLTDVAIGDQAG